MYTHPSPLELAPLELDRQHLHKIRLAFLEFNQLRLHCTRENLAHDQTIFLDTLPLLLQFNHPMLPGYVSRDTPAGIESFTPSKQQLQRLRVLAKSFQANDSNDTKADILSIFIMGSVGTIAQHRMSDIDIWVCHRPDLNNNDIQNLKRKCELLKHWAADLHLEVSLFLMNHEDFSRGQQQILDKESSGSTQHYLLLDEFYRTGIHIAGLLPLWLFINKEQELHYETYAENIIEQRFLPERQFIDFGNIPAIPSSEFISSAIWQLYKSIESPHKSLLKLITLEAYVRGSLNASITSDINKKNLHEYSKDHHAITMENSDPYLNLYHFLEDYLNNSKQEHRLQILRRCFYFKVNKKLSSMTKGMQSNWQYIAMRKLTDSWGWSEDYLLLIDQKDRWKTKQVATEKRKLVNEINHSYHFIVDFFRSTHSKISASTREINILGRKLHAAFSKKPGKIEWLNPSISKDIHEDTLTLKKENSKDITQWKAIDKNGSLLIENTSLIFLLCWLNCNNIITRKTFIKSDSKADKILHPINQWLLSFIPENLKPEKHENYKSQHLFNEIGIFIDIDDKKIEKDFDLFNTKARNSLVSFKTAEIISINSWNEVFHTVINDNVLANIIKYYFDCVQHNKTILLKISPNSEKKHTPKIIIHCDNPATKKSINKIILQLIIKMDRFFSENPYGRYIYSYAASHYLVNFNKNKAIIENLHSIEELYQSLKNFQSEYSAIMIDSTEINRYPIEKIVSYNKKDSVQVFFYHRGSDFDIHLLDENGSFYQTNIVYEKNHSTLKQLNRFLRSISDRRLEQNNISSDDINPLDIFSIEFYQLHDLSHGWEAERCYLNAREDNRFISISAVVESISEPFSVTLSCQDEVFTFAKHDKKVFYKIGLYLLYLKKIKGLSNFYIADIDLSPCRQQLSDNGKLQTIHYLKIQKRLEKKIHQALSTIQHSLS